jgi:hypothetical protein
MPRAGTGGLSLTGHGIVLRRDAGAPGEETDRRCKAQATTLGSRLRGNDVGGGGGSCAIRGACCRGTSDIELAPSRDGDGRAKARRDRGDPSWPYKQVTTLGSRLRGNDDASCHARANRDPNIVVPAQAGTQCRCRTAQLGNHRPGHQHVPGPLVRRTTTNRAQFPRTCDHARANRDPQHRRPRAGGDPVSLPYRAAWQP